MTTPPPRGSADRHEQARLRVDAEMAAARIRAATGQPPLPAPTASNGTGGYLWTDPDELAALIADCQALHDRIRARNSRILEARNLMQAPAADQMSRYQADAAARALDRFLTDNQAKADHVGGYVAKLEAAKAAMLIQDHNAADTLRNAGQD
ncbi:hypothetical protein [Actinokineospora sp.]|uniref:hypothetical protein n=1 Tax=Actinokineospora sp. TaxID=1872133 RepID=UPI0040375EF0